MVILNEPSVFLGSNVISFETIHIECYVELYIVMGVTYEMSSVR